jgi:hypothetical protein
MLGEYKLKGQKVKIEAELEAEVAEKLSKMAKNMNLTSSEILNTALKRFIVAHKDFLPGTGTKKAS